MQRLSIKQMLQALILDKNTLTQFEPSKITVGYYFWNISFIWKERIQIVFEASDYVKMQKLHASDVVYKLVYHANGNLTADWNPNNKILYKALR